MPLETQEQDVHFPKCGIDVSQAYSRQPNRPLPDGRYARTTPYAMNVRGFEGLTQRLRGGSRNGVSKFVPGLVCGQRFIIQDLATIIIVMEGGTMATPSQSGRVVNAVAVCQGNVYTTTGPPNPWAIAANATGNNPPLNYSGLVLSASNNQKLWYADGVNWCVYDPTDGTNGTVSTWAPGTKDSNGNKIVSVLPVDSAGNKPRLIETWRGRTVLSGLIGDSQNWFMSAVGDPTNFDYSPQSTTPTQAVAGNNSPLGLVGDTINAMCPYTDDVLVFFGQNSIWMLNGDPMAGGQIDLVSTAIGGAWGRCWVQDPYGNIYFISNGFGIYVLVPGQTPVRISQPIEQLLLTVNFGTNMFRLFWDDRFQGLWVFISPVATPTPTTHLFFEQRTGAWFQVQFTNGLFNPITGVKFSGNTAEENIILIGSWDGYVRFCDADATTDDGEAISSEVLIGPLLTQNLDEMTLFELQALLGETSGEVNYQVLVGSSAEEALASEPVDAGLWFPGRNQSNHVRESGHAIYLRITSNNPWAMEAARVRLGTRGKVRQRRR